jgi:hypothetical protein
MIPGCGRICGGAAWSPTLYQRPICVGQICFECGFILRLFSIPPDKRFGLTVTVKGREEVVEMMEARGGVGAKYRLNKPKTEELGSQYLGGPLIHLRSIPICLRVSEWLAVNFYP